MNGRDEETMDKIKNDAETAAYGLPVEFRIVPLGDPCLFVYVNGEATGSLIYAPNGIDGGYAWWSVSHVGRGAIVSRETLRGALAAHLNAYIDRTVGNA